MSTGFPLNPSHLAEGEYSAVTISEGTLDGNNYRVEIRQLAGIEGSNNPENDTARLRWQVVGSSNPLECRHGLLNGPLAINTYNGTYLSNLRFRRRGPDVWEFIGEYDSRMPDVGTYTVSVDTTGATIKTTHSYGKRSYKHAALVPETDYGKAIDVQNGTINGTQIIVPSLKIDFRARIANEYLGASGNSPLEYAKTVASLTGSTNSTAMFGGEFAVDELVFAGMFGDIEGENPTLTFRFLASKNLASFDIGDVTGIRKDGHEFIWFEYAPDKDSTSKRLTTKIIAAHVDQVYPSKDLGPLSIGVAPT